MIEVFVDALDLKGLGFERHQAPAMGRPPYHPSTLLKLYIYGYLNRIQSSRRLECETQRNVEVMWLTQRLMPDHKTISDFRKDNGKAIVGVCREFVDVCGRLELFTQSVVAIDGSKFKAVIDWDKNFAEAKMKARLDAAPEKMQLRRQTVEHPFGTLKAWMGATHFLTKTLPRVSTEMSLHVHAPSSLHPN